MKRILPWVGGVAVVGLIAASYFSTTGKSKLNVEEDKIMISEVSKGSFQEFIPVNGIVMPIQTIYLDALEGGRVEELYVEDGAIVKNPEQVYRSKVFRHLPKNP